jgi:nucleotide-binding universal stress UspA family protein
VTTTTVIAWIAEGTWQAVVDAASAYAPDEADVVLLYVTGDDVAAAAHGAFAGLLGRGHPERDPGDRLEALAETAADGLLDAATQRLGRTASRRLARHGRIEQEVVRAAEGADLLICSRDGERFRLGPRSIGPATRFVVDHAPCSVLLVWPGSAPGVDSLPPPPAPHRQH